MVGEAESCGAGTTTGAGPEDGAVEVVGLELDDGPDGVGGVRTSEILGRTTCDELGGEGTKEPYSSAFVLGVVGPEPGNGTRDGDVGFELETIGLREPDVGGLFGLGEVSAAEPGLGDVGSFGFPSNGLRGGVTERMAAGLRGGVPAFLGVLGLGLRALSSLGASPGIGTESACVDSKGLARRTTTGDRLP